MRKHQLRALALMVCAGVASSVSGQTVWYVDDSAPSPGNGASWASAFPDLQSALAAAVAGDEIRVGQGVYLPSASGVRTASFVLRNGTLLAGGYAGTGAANPDERDVALYTTVLSGDLSGNDGPAFLDRADNSQHVVSVFSGTTTTVLDGFTIRGGNADATSTRLGGGMYIDSGSPTVRNCLITHNKASEPFGGGGGVFAYSGTPRFESCTFSGNEAKFPFNSVYGLGGGLYAENATIVDCAFIGNSGNEGGALYIEDQAQITGTLFALNTASSGGAINRGGNAMGTVTIEDCEFSENSGGEGGAIRLFNHMAPFVVRSTHFYGNSANTYGGGILNAGTATVLERCIFSGNSAGNSGGALAPTGNTQITNCTIVSNTAANIGGGVCTISSNGQPRIRNSIVWDNTDAAGQVETSQVGGFFVGTTPEALVDYSCLMGLSPTRPGAGNFGLDPLFVDELNADFSLQSGSPCVNAGDPSAVYNDPDGSRNDVGAVVVQNATPVASAVCQQLGTIGSTATVRLDATGSSDPDGPAAALAVEWFVDGVSVCAGDMSSCGVIEVPIGVGQHTVALRVTDEGSAFDEDQQTITVDAASLAMLESGLVSVQFAAEPSPGTVRYQGEISLPYGVDYTEVAPQIGMDMLLAGTGIVTDTDLMLTRGTSNSTENEWTYSDPLVITGVRRMDVDWRGAEFRYSPAHFPISMQSESITSTQSTLTLRFRIRQVGGAFALHIAGGGGGGQATVNVDGQGNVTADVPFTTERRGRDVTLTLPFAIVPTTTFDFTGAETRSVVADEYLTNSVGRFRIDAEFATAMFPQGSATSPRRVELDLRVGAEGYPGHTEVGPADLSVVKRRWVRLN